MKPFLMGQETELGVSARMDGQQVGATHVFSLLCRELRREVPCLRDLGAMGLYTAQGSRFYLDCGGHPEWSSPELSSPNQLVVYEKAAERLLQSACRRIQQTYPGLAVSLSKNNLCPIAPNDVTYGCHESYTVWVPHQRLGEVVEQLLPHLTTRIVYGGAGCLSADNRGTGYELSQRARHLVRATGSETTRQRAIFSTRVKSTDTSPDGWTRVHLICKDSHRLGRGTYLTCGTTALLIQLINAGHRVGDQLQLADPVRALRDLSLDLSFQVRLPLADGRRLTALEIQEVYLEQCERAVQRGTFPAWGRQVVRLWRETLEALAANPIQLAGKLDIYRKLLVHQHALDQAGVRWEELRAAVGLLARLRQQFPAGVVQAVLNEDPGTLPADTLPSFDLARRLVEDRGTVEHLRLAVRLQMFEFRYHELGGFSDEVIGDGLADKSLPSDILTIHDVERAMQQPPAGGRAAARGRFIAQQHEPGTWSCNWRQLVNLETGAVGDLGDPFFARKPVIREPGKPAKQSRLRMLRELLRCLGR